MLVRKTCSTLPYTAGQGPRSIGQRRRLANHSVPLAAGRAISPRTHRRVHSEALLMEPNQSNPQVLPYETPPAAIERLTDAERTEERRAGKRGRTRRGAEQY